MGRYPNLQFIMWATLSLSSRSPPMTIASLLSKFILNRHRFGTHQEKLNIDNADQVVLDKDKSVVVVL